MTEPVAPEVEAWLAAGADRVIETACAKVYLKGDTAWKLKRAVDYGYLDFSTRARRDWCLTRELEFNSATAPDVYRAVRRLTRTAGGGLELDGPGEAVEAVLEMRRFDEDAVLSEHPERVSEDLAERLGRQVARFHGEAPERADPGLPFTVGSNAQLIAGLAPRLGEDLATKVIDGTWAALTALEPLLEARRAAGLVRRCHGDLHLGNILIEHGEPVIFDCIEFNDALSDIDVLYDFAFLIMDLTFRGRRAEGCRALSAYLDEAARSCGMAVFEGLAALPLMLSVRAVVRAHVHANGGDDAGGRAYLAAALAHLSPPPPRLVAVGGLSGSGKSTFARRIAPELGAAPGAVILRTDEIRKRLMGVGPLEALSSEAYAPGVYGDAYVQQRSEALAALAAGHAVVLDATFIDPAQRASAERLAAEAGVPFDGVWLEAPAAELERRIRARSGDASDATVATLQTQLARGTGEIAWRRLDAGDLDRAVEAWRATPG